MLKLIEWAMAALLSFTPTDKIAVMPGNAETPEEVLLRYQGIVEAAEAAAKETPEKTSDLSDKDEVALLLALAIGESGLAKDADIGPCYKGKGHESRCDGGQSASVWQIWASAHGYKPEEIFADRTLAARLMLKSAKHSWNMCKKLAPEDRFSGLSGRCIVGHKGARGHYHRWMRMRTFVLPSSDKKKAS